MNTESTAGEVKLLPCERIRQVEELDPEALLTACNFPVGVSFAYHDEEGAHDPCFVVLPGGASLALNHWDDELTDIARAVFIVRSCNAAIAATRAATETPTPGLTDDVVKELVEQQITAWAFAHDIDGAIRNDLIARIRALELP